MDKNYWLTRWETGNLGFNQPSPHRFLIKYFHLLNTKPFDQILVPLCGKSIDMVWLMQQQQEILGIELSPVAITQFFEENNIPFEKHNNNGHEIYEHPFCTIYNADLFSIKKEHIQNVSAIYDRAALTALPPETIAIKYLEWLKNNFPKNCKMLLICIEHNKEDVTVPPFNTSFDQLKKHLGSTFTIDLIEREPINEKIKEHWAERGIKELYECAYLIEKIIDQP